MGEFFRKISSNFFFLALLLVCFSAGKLLAQNKPFPQNITYPYGYKTGNITSADIQTYYSNWKKNWLKSDCGGNYLRVEFSDPTGTTVSEGMGYGMLISAYMGDKTTFDKLYAFVKKNWDSNNLMGWKVDCNGPITSVGGSNAATDGDEDIAFSLLLADNQWGGYKTEATAYISSIKNNLYKKVNGRWLQLPGDYSYPYQNTSYLFPAYYRVFKEVSGDPFWDWVLSDAYNALYVSQNSVTGLIPNEVNESGVTNPAAKQVDYNGARLPWRVISDYLWYGDVHSRDICNKMTDWINTKGGLTNIYDGYSSTDGTANGGWNQSPAWTGSWACGAMAKDQSTTDNFANYFKACTYDAYYASSLRLLYSLTLTGNAWKPAIVTSGRITYGNNNNPWTIASTGTTKIEAENYDTGGQGVAYNDTDANNWGGQYRSADGVDIENCSEGGYDIGWTANGEWLEYTVNVAQSGNYTIDTRVASQSAGGQIEITFSDGSKTTGAKSFSSTGGWQTWTTISWAGVALNAGQQTMRIKMLSNGFNVNYVNITPSVKSTVRYEAENATLTGTYTASQVSGYSGTGYVDGLTTNGNKIDFSVNAPSAGNYSLLIRYAACQDQQNFVKVNGTGSSQSFPDNNCSAWVSKTLTVGLNSGTNIISIQKDWGYMIVDYIEITTCSGCRTEDIVLKHKPENKNNSHSQLLYYPNPARTVLNIKLPEASEKVVLIDIADLLGNIVLHTNTVTENDNVQLNISNLQSGIYILKTQRGNNSETGKLIIEK